MPHTTTKTNCNMADDWKDMLARLNVGAADITPETASEASEHVSDKPRLSVKMFYERKGRGGKEATILADFEGLNDEDDLNRLASEIKRSLGTGGSCRGGEILIQGDRREPIRKLLEARGFKVKG